MEEKVYRCICDQKKCPGEVYVVQEGDTLYGIAQKYNCRVRVLLDYNPFVDVYNLKPGEEICVPGNRPPSEEKEFRPYVVKDGDTIGKILKETGCTFEELEKANAMLYNLTILQGTILLIPQKKNSGK